jgi:hypothetical protein
VEPIFTGARSYWVKRPGFVFGFGVVVAALKSRDTDDTGLPRSVSVGVTGYIK